MTLIGSIKDGRIVLAGNPPLPEGADVRVEVIEPAGQSNSAAGDAVPTLGQSLLKFSGKAIGLPPDASRNHDHYLYGISKK